MTGVAPARLASRLVFLPLSVLLLGAVGPRLLAIDANVDCQAACNDLAGKTLADCARLGGTEDECQMRAGRVLESCLQRCQPPPDDCTVVCQEQFNDLLGQCARADGTVDRECGLKLREMLENCLRDCQGLPPPVPCEERCQQRFDTILRDQCTGPDGNVDAECQARAEASLEACLVQCQPQPPPPPVTCEEACQQRFDAIVQNCTSAEGQVDPECLARAEASRDACLLRCQQPPPPPPDDCSTACRLQFEEALQGCASPDGVLDRQCAEEARRLLGECLTACGGEPPPPPVTCEEACQQRFDTIVLENCTSPDGQVNPECLARAEASLESCLERCQRPPPPPPDACDLECRATFNEALAQCQRADGSLDPQCAEELRMVLAECLAACRNEPPPPGCEERCTLRADAATAQCVEAGEDPETCARKGRAILDSCLDLCNGVPPPPRPECKDRCAAAALANVQRCVDEGKDAGECRELGAAFLEQCLQGCENGPPLPCVERCRIEINEELKDCIAAAGAVDGGVLAANGQNVDPNVDAGIRACREKISALLLECQRRCDPALPPPPCEDRCAAHADEALNSCLANGGQENDCRDRSGHVLESCLLRCRNERPPTCAEKCQQEGERILADCVADGEAQEVCEARAGEAVASCREGCARPDPESCQERCDLAAARAKEACHQDNVDPAECEARVQEALDRCIAGCTTPGDRPTCDERCQLAGERTFQACVDAGGSEAECRQRTADFGARCIEDCDRGPAPDCGARCTDISRQVFADCLGGQGDPALGAVDDNGNRDGDPGVDAEMCRERANEVLKACLARCEPRPEPCGEDCARRARDLLSRCEEGLEERVAACVADGGAEAECREDAARECRLSTNEFLARCLEDACPDGDNEPPGGEVPSCEDRCEGAAELLAGECASRGDDPEKCAAHVEELQERCRARCRGEPLQPCEIDCQEIVLKIRLACREANVPAEVCEQGADAFLSVCSDALGQECDLEVQAARRAPLAFQRGDVNADLKFNISDAIGVLGGLFLGQAHFLHCEDAADFNDDGNIDITDPVFGLSHLFLGGEAIPPPARGLGHDPTVDDLICLP